MSVFVPPVPPSRPDAPRDAPLRHRRSPGPRSGRPLGESGQATAEYALVLLGAAAVALMLAAWAAQTGKLGELFDTVVDQIIGRAG